MITKVGNNDHLESGHVIVHSHSSVFIEVGALKFELSFVENPEIKEAKLEASGGDLSLKLTFINYNTGLGNVNTVPLPIGTLENRKLYFNYVIYGFGTPEAQVAKLIHYTFLLGENV